MSRLAGPGEGLVSLSFAEESRETVAAVADHLAVVLGKERVFFYPFHAERLARPNLDRELRSIYGNRSQLIVVFLDRFHAVKEWCSVERRVVQDLIKRRQDGKVMVVKLEDVEDPDFLSIDGWLSAWSLAPEDIAAAILKRLQDGDKPGSVHHPEARVTRPGLARYLFDRAFPRLHGFLTRIGTLPEPPERAILVGWLRTLQAGIEGEIQEKTYLPLRARIVPQGTVLERGRDPFVRPVQHVIRQVLGRAEGGDSASAQIAAVNRRSRLVRNIVRTLAESREPLVLLGDPGSGKTMTLQETVLALAAAEARRVFPVVTLYVRLGELHVDGPVSPREVMGFVLRSSPESIRPWIEDLDRSGRLVLLFDGMDEMSRDRYNEHTEALSEFAGARPEGTKTLFSCRITDFSPTFLHRRLVLLPFDRSQIACYLRRYLPASSLVIEGKRWSLGELARRLAAGELPVDASNPFVLWLLCLFLVEQKSWPESRVQLLTFFNEENYERKRRGAGDQGIELPPPEEAFREWSRLAYQITITGRGAALPVADFLAGAGPEEAERQLSLLQAGKHCGVLAESIQGTEHQIRFEHHRFQEYFAARCIHEDGLEVHWLSRLDAPRWQETMLNLVLLGGEEDGVEVLASSITNEAEEFRALAAHYDEERKAALAKALAETKQIELKKNAQSPFPYEGEAVLADRVEFGARLVHQAGKPRPSVRDRLLPVLREAVALLIERGTPVTQVKMLRACQALEDVDLLRTLEKPLRSPVHWVRDQALILTGRADLAAEMGFDLATYSLLPRLPVFLKAIWANRDARSGLALSIATLLAVVHLAVVLAGAISLTAAIPLLLRWYEPSDAANWARVSTALGADQLLFAQVGIGLTALVFALAKRSAGVWLWCFGSTALGTCALLMGVGLWREGFEFIGLIASLFLWMCLLWAVALAHGAVHWIVLACYVLATRRLRRSALTPSTFMRIAWDNCDYSIISFVSGAIAVFLSIFLGGVFGLFLLVEWLAKISGAPFGPLLVVVLLGAATVIYGLHRAIYAPSGLSWRRIMADAMASWTFLRTRVWAIFGWIAKIVGLFGLGVFIVWLGESTIGLRLARSLVLVALVILAYFLTVEVFRALRYALTQRYPFPPGSFTRQDWKDHLKKDWPQFQENLLRRTTYQTVSLSPAEFLSLLIEIELFVKNEPALSTYWDRRDALEQALRQERRG